MMLKKPFILVTLLILFFTKQVFAKCYFSIQNNSKLNTQIISDISLSFLNNYIENVSEIPNGGISSNACVYKVFIEDEHERIFLSIKGKVKFFAEETGLDSTSLKKAWLKVISRNFPQKKELLCKQYEDLRSEACGYDEAQAQVKKENNVASESSFDFIGFVKNRLINCVLPNANPERFEVKYISDPIIKDGVSSASIQVKRLKRRKVRRRNVFELSLEKKAKNIRARIVNYPRLNQRSKCQFLKGSWQAI